MGNSQGREARPGQVALDSNDPDALRRAAAGQGGTQIYSTRQGRASQNNLSAIFGSAQRHREREGPQDEAALAARRETKAEREAKRIEKERTTRLRERERSMREESVDGGYLVTQGVYTGVEDYNKHIVRSLMIDRRIAPFWPGLEDKDPSWAEHQLIAAVHKNEIPEADEAPAETPHWPPADGPLPFESETKPSTAPIPVNNSNSPLPLSSSPPFASGSLLKGRGKGMASLTVPAASGTGLAGDMTQRETLLTTEPTINGQRLEVYMYKDAVECPICFLFYPPYLNKARCCGQDICSECFVQIKRPDPHPPEHHDDPDNPTRETQLAQEREQDNPAQTLVSEPSMCPYCAQPEFGVTFEPPPWRRGMVHPGNTNPSGFGAATPSASPAPTGSRRRAQSLPATAPQVITTDRIRPEWSQKLAQARANAARRAAAATALHTAAYMMGNRERRLPLFRRGASGRGGEFESPGEGGSASGSVGNSENGSGGAPLDILSLMQAAARGQPGQNRESPLGDRITPRRARAEDIEEMMMMEAIRLSLASEEERHRREEKEQAKEDKKKAKEEKKAEKEARKTARKTSGSSTSLYGLLGGSRSNLTVNSAQPSLISQESGAAGMTGKGKGLARDRSDSGSSAFLGPSTPGSSLNAGAQAHLERSRANLQPAGESSSTLSRLTHLRNLSNASSTSSLVEGSPDLRAPGSAGSAEDVTALGSTPPRGATGLEPTFSFQSLTAMVSSEGLAGEASPPASPPKDSQDASTDFGEDLVRSMQSIGSSTSLSAPNVIENENNQLPAGRAEIGGSGDTKNNINVTSGSMNDRHVS